MKNGVLWASVVTLLAITALGCGGSSSQTDGGAGPGDSGLPQDAGVDAGVLDCANAAEAVESACGALSWKDAAVTSRKRNHHFTFVMESENGAFLYEDTFRDNALFEGTTHDSLQILFDLLEGLRAEILGILTRQTRVDPRYLWTD